MASKFTVGQIVDFGPNATPKWKPNGPYKVMRVLPAEDVRSQRYQVKSNTEPFERTAHEYEMVAAD